MLLKDEHFRNYCKKPILIKNKKFSHQIAQGLEIDSIWEDGLSSEELKEKIEAIKVNDKINAIFAIPYIDHTAGISFLTLSTAVLEGENAVICKRKDFDVMSNFRKSDVNECEFEYLDNLNVNEDFDFEYYREFSKIADSYFVNEGVESLRFIEILDSSRHEDYPDDIQVIFIKENLEPEGMWVRCENIAEGSLIEAKLMNSPYQEFGVDINDTVKVFPYKLDDGHWIVICDLNEK